MRFLLYTHFFNSLLNFSFLTLKGQSITKKAKLTFQGILVSFPLCPNQPAFSLIKPEDHHAGWRWRSWRQGLMDGAEAERCHFHAAHLTVMDLNCVWQTGCKIPGNWELPIVKAVMNDKLGLPESVIERNFKTQLEVMRLSWKLLVKQAGKQVSQVAIRKGVILNKSNWQESLISHRYNWLRTLAVIATTSTHTYPEMVVTVKSQTLVWSMKYLRR